MYNEEIYDEENFPLLVLVDEDGNEHEYEFLAKIEVEGQNYHVLIPYEEEKDLDDEAEIEVIIRKVAIDEEGNDFLADIEDDEEWEKVVAAWQERLDNEEI
jgi:uncharacterized protein YrzB (UPF0473 family)